jgi:nucleotide-binding universal stress UspA family protein
MDASSASHVAVRWAAAEASRRGIELRIIHAYVVPGADHPGFTPDPDDIYVAQGPTGAKLLQEMSGVISATYPDLRIGTRLIQGWPAKVLRSESELGIMTVVGSTGSGRISQVLLGSVALAIVSTNPKPVVVVPAESDLDSVGPIVVGVDGSPDDEGALAFAFACADSRRSELLAVHAWTGLAPYGPYRTEPFWVDPAQVEDGERVRLSALLSRWHSRFPGVTVRESVIRGRATPTLLALTNSAQLLVVGSHGRGGFAGMLLGSTSQAVVAHSKCPVVVVRRPSAPGPLGADTRN